MRLGVVDFLNAYPLIYGLEDQPDIELLREVPSLLAKKLLEGQLDAALVSSVVYFQHQNLFSYHPDLCIAARGKTESIRLFPGPATYLADIKHVLLDYATRSSALLAQYVLGPLMTRALPKTSVVHPPYDIIKKNLKQGEALLLIGDEALRHREEPSYDLGEEYFRLTGRSFVYALWLYPPERERFVARRLSSAYQYARRHRDKMLQNACLRFGFSQNFTKYYLSKTILYEFDDQLKQDMEFFFQECLYYGLI
ncbi:MAG: menaquinone biosynthesis protein [Leptospiraceae bacterium]|nr:menaquinone biosynthesis protein [Leptospiraceae bacterium]MDW8306528.1 menaquinone biosynthesis protein [Leptospiraceae bacterium]